MSDEIIEPYFFENESLREKFPGRVISRNGDYNWSPGSCDLTPLDIFVWVT